jgi:hypothetical protein
MAEEAKRPKPPSSGPHRCSVCGEKAIEVETFGPPIDEAGRRRGVMICAGCGKQSLATCRWIESDDEPEPQPVEAERPDAARPAEPAGSAAPSIRVLLKDLFWLSMLCLLIADASGLLGHVFAPPERRLAADDLGLLTLLAVFALGVIVATTSVGHCVQRVWAVLKRCLDAVLSWRP